MLRYGIRLSVSMATFLFGLALAFVPSLPSSTDAQRGGAFESEVLEANRQYLDAHINRDVAALDRLLAEDFAFEGRFGRVTGKAQRLALLADPDFAFTDISSRGTRVTASENEGEVSGYAVLRGVYAGQDYTSPTYHYTRRFERRGGRWQLVGVEVSRGCGGR